MNLGASAIVLRPRSSSEIFDLACRVLTTLARKLYLRLAASVLLPSLALCLALRHALAWDWVAVWAVAATLGAVLQGVFTIAVSRLLFAESLTARQVLALFMKRLGSYLPSLFISWLVLAVASLALVIGALFAWPRVLFIHEVCLLEGARPMDAVRRSNRFVGARSGAAFAVLLGLLVAQVGIVVCIEVLGQAVIGKVLELGTPFGTLFQQGGSAFALAGYFLAIPFVATARFLHYIDARTRADGWDIQLRFMAIAARDAHEKKVAA